jgi:hypothetical protein
MKLRSPEEQVGDWKDALVDRTKVDNYMMGNIMYYVLTTHWLFEGDEQEVAINKIANHKRSSMPMKYRFSRDSAIRAIVGAIEDCWGQNPRRRPTSRKISNDLKRQLGRIEKVNDLGIVRVSVPPLPDDFRYTDSDFVENMGVSWYFDDYVDYSDEDNYNDRNDDGHRENYENEDNNNHNDHDNDAARGDADYIDEDNNSNDPYDANQGDNEDHTSKHKNKAAGGGR